MDAVPTRRVIPDIQVKAVAVLGQKRVDEVMAWAKSVGGDPALALAADLERCIMDEQARRAFPRLGPAHGGKEHIRMESLIHLSGLAALDGRPISDEEGAGLLGISSRSFRAMTKTPERILSFPAERVAVFRERARFRYSFSVAS
jgi:hypothetical protein